METVLFVTGELPHCRVRSTCDSFPSSDPLTARKAPFVEEKSVKSPEIPARSSGVGASRFDKRDEKLRLL